MENFRGNFFDSYQNNSNGEMRNQYYDPFFVKHRKRTTKAQLKVLEQTFETNIRPDANMRKKLGEQLGMTPRSVQVWFQNRRAKIKKLTQKKNSQQENTDNTREAEAKADPAPAMDYRYSTYHPYVPVQARASGEEFDVYPSNNSIYNYPVGHGRSASSPYEGYGYRAHEEYGYPYAQRYPPEYYPMQYQYNMNPQQQWQAGAPGGKEDEYYQMGRKGQQSNGGSYNDDRM
jgi:LIM homeobox transcription factor 1